MVDTKKRKSKTQMINLPEKFPKGDHSNEDKREKAHIKSKTICFVRNQEHVVPQKR